MKAPLTKPFMTAGSIRGFSGRASRRLSGITRQVEGNHHFSGENISSTEVEDALYKHPAVEAAAVVAMADEKWGERPCAFVELTEGHDASEDNLITWCRDHLAHYKVPERIIFGDLPKTPTGKIKKYILRKKARSL